MDDAIYKKKQDDWQRDFESLCLRCGKCCGSDGDPCANLAKAADGRYTCKVYDRRLGAQKTVSGRDFTCVPIGEVLKKGMPNSLCGYMRKLCTLTFAFVFLWTGLAFSQAQPPEELEYKKFKLEKCACDAAILYRPTIKGMDIGVSAIATGKGAEYRKWRVTDIRIHSGDERIRPDQSDRFYVKEQSLFRIPAAVLFAAIGTQIGVSGSTLEKGIAKAGAAIGFGLLVLAAQGEITGEKAIFHLDDERAEKVLSGASFVEIKLEDSEQHWSDTIKIGIAKPAFKSDNKDIYDKMSRDELSKLIDDLGGRVTDLEKEQGVYKYGTNPEYDQIQSEIEDLQTQRGVAYKVLFEKINGGDAK
ncbi:MAG: hypothetical protein PHI58_00165 [Candidatus Omnitrophica bacterium]|nr:hypothetical protein [Candidatus Omnitrophota bacterium]